MRATLRTIAAGVVMILCVSSAGCESTDKDKASKDEQLSKEERRQRERERKEELAKPPDQVISRDRDARPADDRRSRGLDEIPTTATRVDEGDATRLRYSPTRDGTIYVYDADADRVLFSTRLRQDERFILDPEANRATVDGRTVLGTGLSPRNRYRLYFDRGR